LQLEQVGHVLLEAVGLEMRAGLAINELGVDAHSVLVALHRAFEDIAHVQLLTDLLGVDIQAKAVLRAITKLLRMRDRSVVRFSVMPSAK
jgi:hypothetical protein